MPPIDTDAVDPGGEADRPPSEGANAAQDPGSTASEVTPLWPLFLVRSVTSCGPSRASSLGESTGGRSDGRRLP